MAGPYAALWRIAHAHAPLVVVIYTDPASRGAWVEEMETLFEQSGQVVQHSDGADGLLAHPARPLLVLPEPESEAELIEQLSVLRDRLISRTAPAALFLARDGPGLAALPALPAIASFFQGVIVDPEAEETLDLSAEQRRFKEETGETADAWLKRYHSGVLPDTLGHALLHLRALLLQERK